MCYFCNKTVLRGRIDHRADFAFIEDDQDIRAALRLALEDEGYKVVEAADGNSGLVAFEAESIDLVLLDLRLPDMSGFDVCRELRNKSLVPIIMVTAQTDTHDLVAGLEAGADDYVTKPVIAKNLQHEFVQPYDARLCCQLRRQNLTALLYATSRCAATRDCFKRWC